MGVPKTLFYFFHLQMKQQDILDQLPCNQVGNIIIRPHSVVSGQWILCAVRTACLLRKCSFVNTSKSIQQTHYGESSNSIKSCFFNSTIKHTVNLLADSCYSSSSEQNLFWSLLDCTEYTVHSNAAWVSLLFTPVSLTFACLFLLQLVL